MRIARERVHELWEEAMPLLAAGFRAHDPMPELPLAIDRALYEALEERGLLRVYTARRSAELVGYAVFILGPSPRRQGLLQASQDVLHAGRAGTNARLAVALIGYAERALRAEGVKLIYHSAPVGHAFGRLLERLGYRPTWQTYAKRLEED